MQSGREGEGRKGRGWEIYGPTMNTTANMSVSMSAESNMGMRHAAVAAAATATAAGPECT